MINLAEFERKVYSQSGEDGIIEKLVTSLGITNGTYVEFGVETGDECNTRYLETLGFTGIRFDACFENPDRNIHKHQLTRENILEVFEQHQVPKVLDVLSIDVDFNDFYLWAKLMEVYRPTIVVIEYNACFGLSDRVVPYDASGWWDCTDFYGASIIALAKLGQRLGFDLVYCTQNGVNLFFVNRLARQLSRLQFVGMNDPAYLYQVPCSAASHKRDPANRATTSFAELYSDSL